MRLERPGGCCRAKVDGCEASITCFLLRELSKSRSQFVFSNRRILATVDIRDSRQCQCQCQCLCNIPPFRERNKQRKWCFAAGELELRNELAGGKANSSRMRGAGPGLSRYALETNSCPYTTRITAESISTRYSQHLRALFKSSSSITLLANHGYCDLVVPKCDLWHASSARGLFRGSSDEDPQLSRIFLRFNIQPT